MNILKTLVHFVKKTGANYIYIYICDGDLSENLIYIEIYGANYIRYLYILTSKNVTNKVD